MINEDRRVKRAITIFGHSHVWSVRRALAKWAHPELTVEVPYCGTKELTRSFVKTSGEARLNPLIQELVDQTGRLDARMMAGRRKG